MSITPTSQYAKWALTSSDARKTKEQENVDLRVLAAYVEKEARRDLKALTDNQVSLVPVGFRVNGVLPA